MLSFHLEGKNVVIRDESGIEYVINPTDQITDVSVSGCSEPVFFIVPKALVIRDNYPREYRSDSLKRGLSLVVELRDESKWNKVRQINELRARLDKVRQINELRARLDKVIKELEDLEVQ